MLSKDVINHWDYLNKFEIVDSESVKQKSQ